MVVREQDLDPSIVRWGLHHLLPSAHCAHRPQPLPATTDYAPNPRPPQTQHALLGGGGGGAFVHAPQPPPPQTLHALLDGATAEVRVDAVDNDEVIAQVAMAEASGTSSAADERLHLM